MEEPIVILSIPRSGSSLIAGLFHIHGVWVGRCQKPDKYNPKGYFENLDIKKELKKRYGRLSHTGRRAEAQRGFRGSIHPYTPESGKWLFKCSAMYLNAWHEFSPQFICVRRSWTGTTESNKNTNFLGTKEPKRITELIASHHQEMNRAEGVNVYPDELINRDYSSLYEAFEYCGIKLNEEAVDNFIDTSAWHYK